MLNEIGKYLDLPIPKDEVLASPDGKGAVFSGRLAAQADLLFGSYNPHAYFLELDEKTKAVEPQKWGWAAALDVVQVISYRTG